MSSVDPQGIMPERIPIQIALSKTASKPQASPRALPHGDLQNLAARAGVNPPTPLS
jgi:hypothetical protein